MNCINCGGRITSDGCTCTSTDLLKKLERSNDDWINGQEENAELKRRLKDGEGELINARQALFREGIRSGELGEIIEQQGNILNPGIYISEQERNGVTICVLRKDLWKILPSKADRHAEGRKRVREMNCEYCNTDHTPDPFVCIARMEEQIAELSDQKLNRHDEVMYWVEKAKGYEEQIATLKEERDKYLVALEEISQFCDCEGPGCHYCDNPELHPPSAEAKIANAAIGKEEGKWRIL